MNALDRLASPPTRDYVFQFAASARPKESDPVCFAARTSGLFRSCDGGQSWEFSYANMHASEALPTTSVVISPDFENEPAVFAGLNGAILCSYDGGTKWQRGRLPSPPPAVSALAISPNYTEDGNIFAGTNEDGVLVSQDRGRNWVRWNFGLLDLHILCLVISPGFVKDETLFAGTESGLFRSTNGGRAWRELPLSLGFDAILSVALSPNFVQDGMLFVGTENNGLVISRDKGKSWQCTAETLKTAPVNQIVLFPAGLSKETLILHGGTLMVSKDEGQTWKARDAERPGERDITAVLALNESRRSLLVGSEDGRILRT